MSKAHNTLLPSRTQKYFEINTNVPVTTRSATSNNCYQKSVRTTLKSFCQCVSCKG